MAVSHSELETVIAAEPFVPFVLTVNDGRRIEVKQRDQIVLNSLAVSVVEAAFSVTVVALHQIDSIEF